MKHIKSTSLDSLKSAERLKERLIYSYDGTRIPLTKSNLKLLSDYFSVPKLLSKYRIVQKYSTVNYVYYNNAEHKQLALKTEITKKDFLEFSKLPGFIAHPFLFSDLKKLRLGKKVPDGYRKLTLNETLQLYWAARQVKIPLHRVTDYKMVRVITHSDYVIGLGPSHKLDDNGVGSSEMGSLSSFSGAILLIKKKMTHPIIKNREQFSCSDEHQLILAKEAQNELTKFGIPVSAINFSELSLKTFSISSLTKNELLATLRKINSETSNIVHDGLNLKHNDLARTNENNKEITNTSKIAKTYEAEESTAMVAKAGAIIKKLNRISKRNETREEIQQSNEVIFTSLKGSETKKLIDNPIVAKSPVLIPSSPIASPILKAKSSIEDLD